MRAVVVGMGAVGRRVAAHLAADPEVQSVTIIHRDPARAARIQAGHLSHLSPVAAAKLQLVKGAAGLPPHADVTVVAVATSARKAAAAALDHGSHVVCPADDPAAVRAVLSLHGRARQIGRSVMVGTAMAPGLSCVIAAHVAGQFDKVDEIHVASLGTGGPDCARRHHTALAAMSVDWLDGTWRRRPGGSGRELVWFPDPIGGADCYRGGLADPVLLAPAFPDSRRITARIAATRRDRLTSALPMLRRPHPEGLVGAVRVEVRGRRKGRVDTTVVGAAVPPAVAAAAVSARAARWALSGKIEQSGAGGLAEMIAQPGTFLAELLAEDSIRLAEFSGGAPG